MKRFCYKNPVERIIVNIRKGHPGQDDFPLERQFLHPVVSQSPLHKFRWWKRKENTTFFMQ